ncbi:hypothetical protein ACLKMY_39085 [Paraburkholderia mimosarum]
MQAGQGFGKSPLVSGRWVEAIEPAEAETDRPATRQRHEAIFRLSRFDYLRLDPFVECRLCWLFAGISVIGERYLDRLARGVPDAPIL